VHSWLGGAQARVEVLEEGIVFRAAHCRHVPRRIQLGAKFNF